MYGGFAIHLKKIHNTEDKLHACSYCGKVFTAKATKHRHEQICEHNPRVTIIQKKDQNKWENAIIISKWKAEGLMKEFH
jgi:uncharacterized Zn-finger protein